MGGLAALKRTASMFRLQSCCRYDSVTADGRLDWQNGLTAANAIYFGQCDGIFTNYTWKPHQPMESAERAGLRRHDIYTGIDVFGRGSYGGGGLRLSLVGCGALASSAAVALHSTEAIVRPRSDVCALAGAGRHPRGRHVNRSVCARVDLGGRRRPRPQQRLGKERSALVGWPKYELKITGFN